MELKTHTILHHGHINQILALQQKNLKKNIDEIEKLDQGFVTVEHDVEKLNTMQNTINQIIATVDDQVVGYALSMTNNLKNLIPELKAMFELLDGLTYKNQKLSSTKYYAMGQICVAKEVRGMGVFTKLYEEHKRQFKDTFDYLVTEVSLSNTRSMRAHEKVGFKVIHEYYDPSNNDTWAVVLWDYTE